MLRFQTYRRACIGWQQALLAGVCALLMALLTQAPFAYSFVAGKERGYQSDFPFLQNVHKPESRDFWQERWRWTRPEFTIAVPGIGHRSVVVDLGIVSHRAQWETRTTSTANQPTVLTLQAGDSPPIALSLRQEAARYQVYLPPSALRGGTLRLHGSTEPWQHPQDRRADLGVAIGNMVRLESVRMPGGGLVVPDLGMVGAWSLSLALLWSVLRILRFSPRVALLLLLPLAVLVPLLTMIQAPRVGFGSLWIIQVGLMGAALAALGAWAIPPVLRRLGVAPPERLLSWLLLLVVLSFLLKYGGRLYPESMPGDLQLHVNRSIQTLQGRVYIEAQHRGLPFPFPSCCSPCSWPG